MRDPDRGNLFSAWFLSSFGGAAELGASPTAGHLSQGRKTSTSLGDGFVSCLFNEEWLSLLKPLAPDAALPAASLRATVAVTARL